jgi:hypothetical protein
MVSCRGRAAPTPEPLISVQPAAGTAVVVGPTAAACGARRVSFRKEDEVSETVLVGRGRDINEMPRGDWEEGLHSAPESIGKRLEFMSAEHHAVRNFVVREMPRRGRPFSIEEISHGLGLSTERTAFVVRELEANLFFLARPDRHEVSWAFPVTVEETGHRLHFSTGERLDAA